MEESSRLWEEERELISQKRCGSCHREPQQTGAKEVQQVENAKEAGRSGKEGMRIQLARRSLAKKPPTRTEIRM
jgi:hypothetical protein